LLDELVRAFQSGWQGGGAHQIIFSDARAPTMFKGEERIFEKCFGAR
jgi:hypothetical protein